MGTLDSMWFMGTALDELHRSLLVLALPSCPCRFSAPSHRSRGHEVDTASIATSLLEVGFGNKAWLFKCLEVIVVLAQ